MDLTLVRTKLDPTCTQGELSVNGTFQCYTLELPVKDGLTGSAIPPGKYLIQMLPSPKFESSSDPWVMQYAGSIPHVLGLPATRSNILIHWGNDAADTEGCILVGQTLETDFIGSSRPAFTALWEQLTGARSEVISLEVQGGIPQIGSNAGDVGQAVAEG
jgi:hypothetical protein